MQKSPAELSLPILPKKTRPQTPVLVTEAQAFTNTGVLPKRRRSARSTERVHLALDSKSLEDIRIECVRQKRSLSDAVDEAISTWLQTNALSRSA